MSDRTPLLAAGKHGVDADHERDDEKHSPPEDENDGKQTSRSHRLLAAIMPVRFLLAVLIFFGCANIYALRVNLSMAMVAMVKSMVKRPMSTSESFSFQQNSSDYQLNKCAPNEKLRNIVALATPVDHKPSTSINDQIGTFEWPEAVQSLMLAAFFYGYICTQILGGHLALRYGGYRVAGCGIFGIAFLTVFTEPAARAGPPFLFLLRFLQGFCEGVSYPSFHTMWSRWAPVRERSRLIMISYAGAHIGTIAAMAGTGWICETYGWPTVFYLSGSLGLLWCVIWFWLASDAPETHPFITRDELLYITADYIDMDEEAQKQDEYRNNDDVFTTEESAKKAVVRPPVPWKLLLQSAPVYACCLYSFGSSWCTYTYLTELPAYMHNVLQVSLTANGMLTALPYLALTVVNVVAGISADAAIERGASVTAVRKWYTISAHVLPAPFLLLVTAAGCNFVQVEILLVVALAGSGFSQITVNYLDLVGVEYAGILYGMGNTVSSLGGIILPQVAGWIVGEPEDQSFSTWSKYFVISAVVIVLSAIIYGVLGSGERLPWLDEYLRAHRSLPPNQYLQQPRKSVIPYGLCDPVDGSALGFYQQSEDSAAADIRRRRISLFHPPRHTSDPQISAQTDQANRRKSHA